MAIVIENETQGPTEADTSISWAHTCSGSDRFLLVMGLVTTTNGNDTTTCFYGAAEMTEVNRVLSGIFTIFMFRLINPATGSDTITLTHNSATVTSGWAYSFTGVHQTTPLGTDAEANGSTDPITVDVTGTATDELVIDCTYGGSADAIVADGSQTQQLEFQHSAGRRGGTSTEAGNGGTVTMSWTGVDGSSGWAILAVAVKPAAAGAVASGSPQPTLFKLRGYRGY